jgi:hypothetical protein
MEGGAPDRSRTFARFRCDSLTTSRTVDDREGAKRCTKEQLGKPLPSLSRLVASAVHRFLRGTRKRSGLTATWLENYLSYAKGKNGHEDAAS